MSDLLSSSTDFLQQPPERTMPRHIAVIPDGNRRWARAHGLPLRVAQQRGTANVGNMLAWSREKRIDIVTVWMLSTNNLLREPTELDQLVPILTKLIDELADCGEYRLRHIGDRTLLPETVAESLTTAEERTAAVNGMDVNLAVGYSGRLDMLTAIRRLLDELSSNPNSAIGLTELDVSDRLFTSGQPDPDLVIRTSGEIRLSGFMIWQAAEAEFLFSDKLWPDFTHRDFTDALDEYSHRERRLGR